MWLPRFASQLSRTLSQRPPLCSPNGVSHQSQRRMRFPRATELLHHQATPPLPPSSPLPHPHLSKATRLPCPLLSRWSTSGRDLSVPLHPHHLHPACQRPSPSPLKTKCLHTPRPPQVMEPSRLTALMKSHNNVEYKTNSALNCLPTFSSCHHKAFPPL